MCHASSSCGHWGVHLSLQHCSSRSRVLHPLHSVPLLICSHPLTQAPSCAPWGDALGCDLFGRCTLWYRICRGSCRLSMRFFRGMGVRLRVWWGQSRYGCPRGWGSDKCRIYGKVTTTLDVSCSGGGTDASSELYQMMHSNKHTSSHIPCLHLPPPFTSLNHLFLSSHRQMALRCFVTFTHWWGPLDWGRNVWFWNSTLPPIKTIG